MADTEVPRERVAHRLAAPSGEAGWCCTCGARPPWNVQKYSAVRDWHRHHRLSARNISACANTTPHDPHDCETNGPPAERFFHCPGVAHPSTTTTEEADHIPERWTITFERIGRNRSVSDLVIFIEDPDDEREMAQVASDIQRHIGGHLGSREWGWYIDDEDNLWIENGRFGRGAVAVEHLDAVALPSTSGGGS